MSKAVYQFKNWPEYNEALVKRGEWVLPSKLTPTKFAELRS